MLLDYDKASGVDSIRILGLDCYLRRDNNNVAYARL
jgi:aryl carrier-like protein